MQSRGSRPLAGLQMKLILVAGARPNFMKVAPIMRALRARGAAPGLEWRLVHTGQHYDHGMSKVFFEELEIPEPDYDLGCGSGSHAEQTAKVMVEFEKVCRREAPDVAVVVGDVNSTLACSVTARKLGTHVAHVEAGLRSRDWGMPEEINRVVTDAVADLLFVSERSGLENLAAEGRHDGVHFVGNVMVDTLLHQLRRLEAAGAGVRPSSWEKSGDYAVVTLHRPSNVDDAGALRGLLEALAEISRAMPVAFPAHPRTRSRIVEFGLGGLLEGDGARICLMDPLPYMSFLDIWKDAALVLTDSGGLQEETTALGVPCFTVRENTERPITIEQGTNVLVGTSKEGILGAWRRFRGGETKQGRVPELWDGRAAERIVDVLSGLVMRTTSERNV